MVDLVEFLRARLDEDEQVARECWDDHQTSQPLQTDLQGLSLVGLGQTRMLAEVEAKRRIIDLHREWWTSDQNHCVCDEDECIYPCETLRLLALPYADHDDYQQEWKL